MKEEIQIEDQGICEDCGAKTTVEVTYTTTLYGDCYITRCICFGCREE